MSAVNVCRLSAKYTCMPVASWPCSTSARSTTCDNGRYDNMRVLPSSGTRLSAVCTAHANAAKLCITPFGAPVVPDV